MKAIAKIVFAEKSFLWLGEDAKWRFTDKGLKLFARVANFFTKWYEYSPSHGSYGALLSAQIAGKIGGKVELPKVPEVVEPPKDVVF